MGTLVEERAEEEKFDFADHLKSIFARMYEEGIKKREIGVGFVVSFVRNSYVFHLLRLPQDLTVRGLGAAAKFQPTIFSMLSPTSWLKQFSEARHPPVKDILSNFTGVVHSGEMLCRS